jgi:hypothetical protein
VRARYLFFGLMTALGAVLIVEAVFDSAIAAYLAIGILAAMTIVYAAHPELRSMRRPDDEDGPS